MIALIVVFYCPRKNENKNRVHEKHERHEKKQTYLLHSYLITSYF